jgi:hypothetical protein
MRIFGICRAAKGEEKFLKIAILSKSTKLALHKKRSFSIRKKAHQSIQYAIHRSYDYAF